MPARRRAKSLWQATGGELIYGRYAVKLLPMTADQWLAYANALRNNALSKVRLLRRQFPDAEEFGRHAAPVIDSLVNELAAGPDLRGGRWDDSEREFLRAAYEGRSGEDAMIVAQQNIMRTRSQIYSMARNMGLA